MRNIIIKFALSILRFINLFYKPLALREKVVIISRQSDTPTLDIQMLSDCLMRQNIETTVLTRTLKKSIPGALSYGLHMLQQMHQLATSRVVVIDGYCVLVSVLPKKKDQKVIQMWHALGAIKKFGWQNTENPDGHGREFAEIMNMHKNYDYVLTPSEVTGHYFAEAFRVPESTLVHYGLPRIDFLRDNDQQARQKIENRYPKIVDRTNILYVPTFRKNAELGLEKFISAFDFKNYNLIIKKHFLDKGDYSWAEDAGAIVDADFSSLEWLRICQKVITDYSAIAFEAAILDRDIYIYQPDVSDYTENVGLNVNLSSEAIGEYVCRTEEELFSMVTKPYKREAVVEFRRKYIEIDINNCTGQLCDFIAGLLKNREE